MTRPNPQPVVARPTMRRPKRLSLFSAFARYRIRLRPIACIGRPAAGRYSATRTLHFPFARRRRGRHVPSTHVKQRLYNHPVVRIDGHGGGRWYNFHQESSRGHGRDYRHLLVEGTTEPLHLYQCNPEHAQATPIWKCAAQHVSLYGVKGEYNQPIIWVRDCDHVRIFGYGGNAAAHEGHALFVVDRTPNFLLANLVDSPRMPQGIPETHFAGDGVRPAPLAHGSGTNEGRRHVRDAAPGQAGALQARVRSSVKNDIPKIVFPCPHS